MSIRHNQQGIGTLGILVVAGTLFIVGLAGWSVFAAMSKKDKPATNTAQTGQTETDMIDAEDTGRMVRWDVNADGTWKAVDPNPPICPVQPMMQAPATFNNLTLVQYPGQTRDGAYKTVGTLTFTGIGNDVVEVTAPMDATVLRGSRYVVSGEMQYNFDFVNSCGVMYRLGHLRKLTSSLEAIANTFPETSEHDGKTSRAPEGVTVMAGERIATSIGLQKAGKTFFDFGVYDLRTPNVLSQNTGYIQQNGLELAGHGVCWFDWLPPSDAAKARNAGNAQPTAAKKNDYCLVR
jgi:hypothetical protein